MFRVLYYCISLVPGIKQAFYTETVCQCLWRFYGSQLITNIENSPCTRTIKGQRKFSYFLVKPNTDTLLPAQVVSSTLTKINFRRIFAGSEAVVSGKLTTDSLTSEVEGQSASGNSSYSFTPTPLPPGETNRTASYSERLWAYLTIQQLLDKQDGRDTDSSVTQRNYTHEALQLALRVSTGTCCGKVSAKRTCVWQG